MNKITHTIIFLFLMSTTGLLMAQDVKKEVEPSKQNVEIDNNIPQKLKHKTKSNVKTLNSNKEVKGEVQAVSKTGTPSKLKSPTMRQAMLKSKTPVKNGVVGDKKAIATEPKQIKK